MKLIILFLLFVIFNNVDAQNSMMSYSVGSYATDDSCGTQYHKQTIGNCANEIETLEDCRLAASAFGLSVAQPITWGARPQGCWIGLNGDVWFNNMPNPKTCDEEQIQFCFCRTSALHCRTQMERPSTETLTPPAYQRDEGIFSKSGASDLSSAEVADSLPFHTEFTVDQSTGYKQLVENTNVSTTSLFYLTDTGRNIFKQVLPSHGRNYESNPYTYKKITESQCSDFGWESIESPQECQEAARYLHTNSEQMQIEPENNNLFEQDSASEPKGCYHKWVGSTSTKRLYHNVGVSTQDCSGIGGCICKIKRIKNYMVRNSGYCTDIAGWTVIPTVVECDFASKNIPEYLDTLPTQQVIRTIDELNLVGSTHKVAVPGCYLKEETKDGITDMVLHFNVDVNPQGQYSFPGLGSFFNDNTIMKKCSATELCVCKRAPFKTVDSGRCNDKAGWTNIEDRATPSMLDTHDVAGECRKAVEHLSSNSNLLSKAMNMGNSNNPQITGLDPNMGYVSHVTNPVPASIPSVDLLNHMTGTYDIGFKPAGCSIKTDTFNPSYSFNRGTREEIFIMAEYGGQEYARHPYSTNNVDCSAQNQCVCKRVPEYIKVCVSCDGAQSTCLQFQNVDAETLMEIDWNAPGTYPLGIYDNSGTLYALVISASLDWKIGTVTYTDTIRSDTPPNVGFTYEYVVKRVPTFITVFAEGSQNDGTAKKCNNVLTVNAVITVEKFTMEKSIPDLQKRVATSGTCADFNYDEISCDSGSCLCERKEENMYKEITSGFCEKEKGWLPITSKADCEAVLSLPAYSGYTSVTEGSMRDRPSGCLVYDFTVGSQLIFNTFDTTISQTTAHTMLRSICQRASFHPVSLGLGPREAKKWNELAQMDLEHIIVPDETNTANTLEVAVREETNRPIYDDSIVLREWDGNNINLYNEYRVIDTGICENTPGWESITSLLECTYILNEYEFVQLDISVIISSGGTAPNGCTIQHDSTDGFTIRSGTSSSMTCGSSSPSNNVYVFHRCLCKRISNEFANDERVNSDNKLHGFRPFIDSKPTRDIATPTASCDGDGCVSLNLPIIDINECATDPCQNNATCRESGNDSSVELGEYTCDCLPGYNGTNCEEDINECALMNVTAEYELIDYYKTTNGRVTWTTNCQEICENAGMTCTREGIKKLMIQDDPSDPCRLQIDFFSDLLSIPANEIQCRECATDPKDFDYNYWPTPNPDSTLRNCYSGGLAEDLSGGITTYEIIYNTQWNEAEAYDCETKPGTLFEHDSTYRHFVCNCVNFNPIPCKNNATCVESSTNSSILASDYYCACPPRYSGKNCTDFDIDECDPDPCQNGATCTETSDGITPTTGVYHCECAVGFTGENCEIDIDECNSVPSSSYVTHARVDDASASTSDDFASSCEDVCQARAMVCNEQMFSDILGNTQGISGVARSRCQIQVDVFLPLYGVDVGGSLIADGSVQAQQSPVDWICSKCPEYPPAETIRAQSTNPDCLPGVYYGLNPTNTALTQNIFFWNMDLDPSNGYDCDFKASENVKNIMCSCTTVSPCQNSGVCTETSDGSTLTPGVYHCECPDGYNGTNCEEDINECDPDPCQNSGVCTETSDGSTNTPGVYHCECPTGYNGTNCEEDINECDPDPCQNGAFCTSVVDGNGNTGYTCECPTGYAGTNCEEDINECDPDPCQNGATCTETLDGTTLTVGVYHCECVAGFEGYACHIEIPCDTNPCQNGATCSEIVSTDPPPTYTIIGNQNTCSSYGDGYRGLTADECENVPNTVSMTLYGDGLGNHTYGACAYNGMGGTMLGVIDEIQTDLCFFVTCACLKPVVEYNCLCPTGYNGTNCQFDINACEPDPCENGGICNNTIQEKNIYETTQNLPSCNDLLGFDEIITEEDCLAAAEDADGLYPLESNFAITNINYPTGCLIWRQRTNGAVIWNVNPNAAGVCSQQDECLCKNSEIQRLSDYTCNCTEGFTGENCTVLTLCDPDPCQNGATCTERLHSNGTEYFNCDCLPGYKGTICDEDINECDPDPCQNGATCTESNSTNSSVALGEYTCDCPLGFEGFQCHISRPCSLEPCQNNATCTEDVVALTYRIINHQQTCPDLGTGYRGLTADECENYPNTIQMVEYQGGLGNHTYGACAVNEFGGTMIGVIDDNQPSLCFYPTCACILPEVEPICDCMLGYDGDYCEYGINACDNQPCQNSAECSSKLIMQDFDMFVEDIA